MAAAPFPPIHWLNKYFLSTYYVPGAMLDAKAIIW